MHIEIRLFPGTASEAGKLTARRSELEALLAGIPGLSRFEVVETRDGLALITTADDPAIASEGHRRLLQWLAPRVPGLDSRDAFAIAGEVIASRSE